MLVIFIFVPLQIFAQQNEHNEKSDESSAKFNPSKTIFEHIGDAYDWHIASFGEGSHKTHISIPLPVILFSDDSGFHIFMSYQFHHGHASYKNFRIATSEEYKGKVVEVINGKEYRPYDISITKNTLSLFISLGLIIWIFMSVAKAYRRREGKAPRGIQSLIEPLIIFVRDDIAKASISKNKYKKFTPFLLSIFFFIFLNNLLGLIPFFPGGANLTGNISITLVLAVFTFIITTVNSNKNYWVHIINTPGVPWWLKIPLPLMPFVEILGIFIKPFVLMVRLFANITAGHIVVLGFFCLIFIFGETNLAAGFGISIVSVAFTVFLFFLELLAAFIQAYVFTLLSALYFGMATEEHH